MADAGASESAAATPRAAASLLDKRFIARLEQLEFICRRLAASRTRGERRSRARGHSTEFADYRPYVVGDDLRHLDWSIFGRLERLFVRLYEAEEDLGLTLLIDRSRSMRWGEPDKLEFARRLAAALGVIGLANGDRVRVGALSDRLELVFGPARSRSQLLRLLSILERLGPDEGAVTDLGRGCRDLSAMGGLSGLVIVISDFFDRHGFEAALRSLSGSTREVWAIQVLAPDEIEPRHAGDLRLVDLEDGEAVDVSISRPLLRADQRTLAAFRADLQAFCARRGIHCLFTASDAPFDRLVLDFFRRRGMLR